MAVSAQERRLLLDQTSRSAQADVAALWAAAAALDVDFARFVIDGFPDVVDPWIALSAELSAVWFEETLPVPAVVAEPIPLERLQSSASWALGADGDKALDRLTHTTQRAVYDGARDTTLVNVERNNIRWARDARPDACAFCRMLATRTFDLYRSRNAAAKKVHDDCHCLPIEVADPDYYELPEHVQVWEDEYRKARADAGTSKTKDILSSWRAQQPEYR